MWGSTRVSQGPEAGGGALGQSRYCAFCGMEEVWGKQSQDWLV